MCKTTKILSLLLIIFISANVYFAQKSDCFEIKHLDFFGLNQDSKINWSDQELDELNRIKNEGNSYWLIPPLVFQLRDFHPNCKNEFNQNRYEKLIKLYFKVRKNKAIDWDNKPIENQLKFIREDFYQQLYDEKIFPFMSFTMDDGPLYGKIPKTIPNIKQGKSIKTSFGKITIVETKSKVYLIATNENNKVIWSRIMTGVVPKRYLQNLNFHKNPLEEMPFATIVHLHTSERLTLYLKPDGKFICYFHSW
jgi:hypothetical protein